MAGVEGAEKEGQENATTVLKKTAEVSVVSKPHVNGDAVQVNGDVQINGHEPQVNGDHPTMEMNEVEKKDDSGVVQEECQEIENKEQDEREHDIILIQDTGFLIQIAAPGIEPFDLPVSSMEMVQEIYQVLIDREDTCHRTCFSLQLDGVTLDSFAELKSIDGLKEGSVIKVVEEPYTIREARIHVRHVRDLLKSVDLNDAYNGIDCNSLAFLNVVTSGDVVEKRNKKIENLEINPPEYVLPNSKERPLLPLHPLNKDLKVAQCIKVMTFSGWNPPPGNRKMHGDLLYLYVVTLEDKRYHITASTKGFYVNQSTQDDFNPKAAPQANLSHSLIDLLSQFSPMFKRNFSTLLKKRAQKHPFERVATPYQVYSWLSPHISHTVDSIRAEDAFSSRLGYEEHIPGQTRDWNEELQTTRELSRKNLPERLIRERAIFKVHSDFVVAATRGAMAVIDGNIMAINPGEDAKMQMFLWNNIFFSLGFDVKDHYKDFGGDAAAYAAPTNDLHGVRAYASVDTEGLYTLGTVVVDYRGFRVTAQSIIPGILEREQEQSVVYGSVDFGKTVVTNDKYKDLLQKTAQSLKIRPHKVLNEKEEEVELYSSVECKGIVGNDSRHYVLDLLRTFPPDMNFLPMDDETLSEEVVALGYPRQHPHKLVSLRHELVDAFVESRYVAFVKHAAMQFQQLRLKKMSESAEKAKAAEEGEKTDESKETIETDEAKKIVEALTDSTGASLEESSKEIVRQAAEAVGSLTSSEFNVSFNPDLFQPHVRHAPSYENDLKADKEVIKDAAKFLLTNQIPFFVRDCLEHTSSPVEGFTLTEALHHQGINIRYLGTVTDMVAKHPQLSYVHSICISEMVSRAAKHLYKTYMHSVETTFLSSAIAHFLNCYLGAYPSPTAHISKEEIQSQRSRKKKNKRNKMLPESNNGNDNLEWTTFTPKTLWRKITDEIQQYFQFTLDSDNLDATVEMYSLQKVSLLRMLAKKLGLQLSLREYQLENRHKQPFHEDDILNVFPVVKHIHPKATDAYHVFTSGQQKIQQGLLRDGYELISEALNLLNNVYGAMHPEISACARLLARLNYIMGDYHEALAYQQRAVLMSERVLGIDHPNTITEYAHLALYCFANNQVSAALALLYRSRYLALLCHGENHPEVALFDSNIGLILQAVGEFDLSLRFLQKAHELNMKFFGNQSLKVAMSYHFIAQAQSCKGDFRTALNHEREAYTIYKQSLGEGHERTKESSECLKHLTQQAVKFQKTMNEIYKGDSKVSIPPIQIQTPSLANVLDTLNLINGIVFVHISQEDIEKFKEEMVRRQVVQQGTNQSAIEEEKKPELIEKQLVDIPIDDDENPSPSIKETKDEDLEAGR